MYLPFVERLREFRLDPGAVDLGSGRGEWLELMRQARIDAYPVRLDDGMLAAFRRRRLSPASMPRSGRTEDVLAMKYDRSIGDRLDEILARVEGSTELSARQAQETRQQSEARAQQAEARVRQAQGETGTVRQELHKVHQANHHHWQRAEERGQHVQALLSSTSWRVPAPIRWLAASLRLAGRIPGRVVLPLKIWLKPLVERVVTSPALKQMIERTGRWVMARGKLSDPIRVLLRRHERLRNRLRRLILGQPPPGVVIAAQEECVQLAARTPRLPVILDTRGVNARQRTPLESNFLAYAGPE